MKILVPTCSLLLLTALVGCGTATTEVDTKAADAAKAAEESAKQELQKKRAQQLLKKARKLPVNNGRPAPILAEPATVDAWLAEAKITRDSKLAATLKTNLGDIQCELWPDASPMTVANFVGLAEGTKTWTDPKTNQEMKGKPLYDGTVFHRIIDGFMIQGGDPLGMGTGGPGYRFDDETENGKTFDKTGLLAMANSGPKTNGSQFFITVKNTPHLNGRHTIFGHCEQSTVDKIAKVKTAARSKPVEPVVIETIKIERK